VSAKTGAGSTSCARRSRGGRESRAHDAARRGSTSTGLHASRHRDGRHGTLWSGSIGAGDRLRVEPAGSTCASRSVQVHDAAVERAEAGQRVAVNLPGVERDELARGDALVTPGAFATSYRLDVRLERSPSRPRR
jgi:selenocysteine-specific elongation factor